MEEIYLAGGCLWGVQEYVRHLRGVEFTEAGRANGVNKDTSGEYDGYAECVRIHFDSNTTSVHQLMHHLFEIIDPYSVNKQGDDVGLKYRTGVYSKNADHLAKARKYIDGREDRELIVVEVLPLSNYVRSDTQHQNRLALHPNDYCHIPKNLLHKYKRLDNEKNR